MDVDLKWKTTYIIARFMLNEIRNKKIIMKIACTFGMQRRNFLLHPITIPVNIMLN